jgi:hypothetical protein
MTRSVAVKSALIDYISEIRRIEPPRQASLFKLSPSSPFRAYERRDRSISRLVQAEMPICDKDTEFAELYRDREKTEIKRETRTPPIQRAALIASLRSRPRRIDSTTRPTV